LEHAGFVQSLRGRDGGYQLIKPLDTFTLFDIVAAIDENLFINECLRDDKLCPLNPPEYPCKVHIELVRIQNRLIGELQLKTVDKVITD